MKRLIILFIGIQMTSCGMSIITTSKKVDLINIESNIELENFLEYTADEIYQIEDLSNYKKINPIKTQHCSSIQTFKKNDNDFVLVPKSAFRENIKREKSNSLIILEYRGFLNFSNGGDDVLDYYLNNSNNQINIKNTFDKTETIFTIDKFGKIKIVDKKVKKINDSTFEKIHILDNIKVGENGDSIKLIETFKINFKKNISVKRTIKDKWICD
ncbi:hypothetical protein EC396_12850 [Lutibacter sp. HS1-25]|uniref:hypothetical protein n=1 Tax=Lutibacter sp. HS1-25 TaxID=2485000 RepID=UPI0010104BAD|nr:hypothetical protein [Lutibacter sp. HS1-25]RXP47900.1 hypothetical protein EC396_12900 [Lutibacter sp. HS1-25]RXP47901.1 hypothetical protein EC396_12905 [Lutibacter sp. HS1-25]RXP48126.1 hypothetical protein EC396_12850 [Lutibacter sp. HS1-25]